MNEPYDVEYRGEQRHDHDFERSQVVRKTNLHGPGKQAHGCRPRPCTVRTSRYGLWIRRHDEADEFLLAAEDVAAKIELAICALDAIPNAELSPDLRNAVRLLRNAQVDG